MILSSPVDLRRMGTSSFQTCAGHHPFRQSPGALGSPTEIAGQQTGEGRLEINPVHLLLNHVPCKIIKAVS